MKSRNTSAARSTPSEPLALSSAPGAVAPEGMLSMCPQMTTTSEEAVVPGSVAITLRLLVEPAFHACWVTANPSAAKYSVM